MMRHIDLDAAKWDGPLDFYKALLPALGAPEWHGMSIAAIVDSMISGEINEVEPPYTVRIQNLTGRPEKVVEEVEYAEGAIVRRRDRYRTHREENVEAYLEIVS